MENIQTPAKKKTIRISFKEARALKKERYMEEFSESSFFELTDALNGELEKLDRDELKIGVLRRLISDAQTLQPEDY